MSEDEDDESADDGCFDLPPGDRSLAGLRMERRDLTYARLSGVDLTGAGLYWASMHGVALDKNPLRASRSA